ncbi:C40 family peptidase [Bacillus sp. USDA818B3_A]|uniref:C40 family peptidase n=1 Tax=Bacillus sp. USDA818B3_A TaxID=2698834 RepID=UPI001F322F3F|nr:C40 family peptidase [Bacillus sp. USDA818B3_A]
MVIKKVLKLFGLSILLSSGEMILTNHQAHAEILSNSPVPPSTDLSDQNKKLLQVSEDLQENMQAIQKAEQNQEDLQLEIHKLEINKKLLNEKLSKRTKVLKERAIAYQHSDRQITYLEVLMGSTSLSDFFNRTGALAAIAEADRELIEQQENEQKKYVLQEENLHNNLTALDKLKDNLEKRKTTLEKQQAEFKEIAIQVERPSMDKSGTPAAPSNIIGEVQPKNGYILTVINAGKKYIGRSTYVFGGGRSADDIAHGRFDCSGFVHWAFAEAGIQIGQNTDSIKQDGRQVSPANMQPGDLVFFDTYKRDGHVGIYIGGGKFIGSQSSTGVAIADMTSGYWKSTFNGRVVRI